MDVAAISAVATTGLGHSMFSCVDTGSAVRLVIGATTFEIVYSGSATRTQQAIETIVATLCATSEATAATARLNALIDEAVADSTLTHEAIPHGVPASYSWYAQAVTERTTPPTGWTGCMPWGTVYVDQAAATTAPNTRVEIRRIEIRILSASTQTWTTTYWRTPVGYWYPEDFKGAEVASDVRTESNGNISATAGNGKTFHFFSSGRLAVDPNDIAGVLVTTWARLVVADRTQPDDRSSARYAVNTGGDWWIDTSTAPNGSNVTNIGGSRYKYVTNDWRAFRYTTLSAAQLRAKPPLGAV